MKILSMNIEPNDEKRKIDWNCQKCSKDCKCKGFKAHKFDVKQENSLVEKFPVIADQMNANKNNGIGPGNINAKSSEKYCFICSYCNEDFISSPKNISKSGDKLGCPKCKTKFNPEK